MLWFRITRWSSWHAMDCRYQLSPSKSNWLIDTQWTHIRCFPHALKCNLNLAQRQLYWDLCKKKAHKYRSVNNNLRRYISCRFFVARVLADMGALLNRKCSCPWRTLTSIAIKTEYRLNIGAAPPNEKTAKKWMKRRKKVPIETHSTSFHIHLATRSPMERIRTYITMLQPCDHSDYTQSSVAQERGYQLCLRRRLNADVSRLNT